MPSPLGHALGGLAVGLLASPRLNTSLLAACAIAGALADVDFLLPLRHRGPSHSIGAAAMVGLAAYAWLKTTNARTDPARIAALIAAAYGTHVLFDWLGADSSTPRGLMALWPFSPAFFISDLDVFNSVDRRYWLDGFWRRTVIALLREVVILVPLIGIIWFAKRRP